MGLVADVVWDCSGFSAYELDWRNMLVTSDYPQNSSAVVLTSPRLSVRVPWERRFRLTCRKRIRFEHAERRMDNLLSNNTKAKLITHSVVGKKMKFLRGPNASARGHGLLYEAELAPSSDLVSKPLSYYGHYDDFIHRHSVPMKSIIEVGTHYGESVRILARAYPMSRILAIDIIDHGINFSDVPNVTFLCVSQSAPELADVVSQFFPDGVDLVIDDGCHFGYESMMTFDSLFPLLRPGGGYFVEDWGTGYWDSWTDGSRLQRFLTETSESAHPKRFPSHDFGMVGFVKSLVDLVHDTSNYDPAAPPPPRPASLGTVEFRAGVVMCLKA